MMLFIEIKQSIFVYGYGQLNLRAQINEVGVTCDEVASWRWGVVDASDVSTR